MIVEFLSERYKCNSDLGLYYADKDTLLSDLNEVIELNLCMYPVKWVETEDKKAYRKTRITQDEFFNGQEKKLVPGMMFIYDGQIFAIDSEKRLILYQSETGVFAIRRFVNEILNMELSLIRNGDCGVSDIKIEEIEKIPEEILENSANINYYLGKLWKERTNFPDLFKITFSSTGSFTPIEFWVNHLIPKIYYNPKNIFEDQVEDLVFEFLSWSYNTRKKDPDSDIEENQNSEDKNTAI